MKFLSLEPFVPSGSDFETSKQFFQGLGFIVKWDAGDYIGFENTVVNLFFRNTTTKILQKILW